MKPNLSNYPKDGNDPADLSCVILLGLIALPFILSALFTALIPFILVGTVGFIAYRLYIYDQKTGNLTAQFEEWFNLPQSTNTTIEIPPPTQQALPPVNNEEMRLLKAKIESLELENERIRKEQKNNIKEVLREHTDNISKKEKKQILDNFFQENTTDYKYSDQFEREENARNREKKEDDLRWRGMEQEMREELFETKKYTHDTRHEMRQDMMEFKEVVRVEFQRVFENLRQLETSVLTLRSYVDARFNQFEIAFHQTIADVRETIGRLRVELKEDVGNLRLETNREFVNIHKQQQTIIGKMAEYEASVKKFAYDVMQVKVDAQKMNMRSEHMMNRANVAWQKSQNQIQMLSKDIALNLKEISVHKADFANSVGKAKLELDNIQTDIFYSIKDISYERVGVEALRDDHTQRVALENQKMNGLIQEKRHLEEKIQMRLSKGKEVAGLQHQLYMTRENLNHSHNRNSLLQQEQRVFNKLAR